MFLLLVFCSSIIVIIFWNQELKYSLPTPVPSGYQAVVPGTSVEASFDRVKHQASFLHFYNPDCPCSRFNARHLKSLIRSYGDSVQVVIVVERAADLVKAKAEFGDNLSYLIDDDKLIARQCGVYSTPQAAIIDDGGRLFFRGNYNKTRYCTQKATNFAELALIAMLNHQPAPVFGLLSSQSYGCSLPGAEEEVF